MLDNGKLWKVKRKGALVTVIIHSFLKYSRSCMNTGVDAETKNYGLQVSI